MAAVLRSAAMVVAAAAVGAVSALVGTAIHLWTLVDGSLRWPVGFLLAVALVASVDTAVAVASRSAAALLGVTAGRAAALAALLVPGPGGDVVVIGVWQSEAWALTAVLLPGLAAPLVSAWTSSRRARARARAVTVTASEGGPRPRR